MTNVIPDSSLKPDPFYATVDAIVDHNRHRNGHALSPEHTKHVTFRNTET